MQISKIRAYEFCLFLACSPMEVQSPSDYIKLQRLRKKIQEENKDFEEKFEKYKIKFNKEKSIFVEALKEFKFDEEKLKEKAAEFDAQLTAIMEPDINELNKYVEENGKVIFEIETEDLAPAKKLFEKIVKVNDIEVNYGAKMWADPEAYLDIAALLGIS